MSVEVVRLRRRDRAVNICIPPRVLAQLCWKVGDALALRVAGEKCVMERLPLEQMAVIRTGEATRQP